MRTTCAALVLLALLAAVSAQQVITDFSEFQRKKAEYDAQKAKYDEFQALRSVPVLASYDLISKVKEHEAPAGNAEQLLPTYTGIPVNFNEAAAGRALVEPGNTQQNYFHDGPIPAKKSSSPSAPVVIPTGPGQDFIVPQNDGSAVATPAAAETPFSAPAPITAAPAAAPDSFSPAAPASSGQALFFGRGAVPVTTTTSLAPAAAPIPAPPSFASSAAAFGSRAVPLRPLGREFQLVPYLPFSDFHPGPVRAVPTVPQAVRQGVIPEAPVPLFARETVFAHDFPAEASAARSLGGVPAATYGPPGFGL